MPFLFCTLKIRKKERKKRSGQECLSLGVKHIAHRDGWRMYKSKIM